MSRIPRSGRILHGLNQLLSSAMVRPLKPDIIHETYYRAEPSMRSSQVPRIVTVHDMIHELLPDPAVVNDPIPERKKRAVERADHVICVSENTRKDLLNTLDLDPSKVTTIHLGFSPLPQASAKIGGRPFVLFVGARAGYKNFSAVILAFAMTPELRNEFQLVAFGGGPFTVSELSQMTELGLSRKNCIQLSGDDQLLSQYFSEAAAFVYPSLYEGFGIPPLEAMAANCPVVCTNRGSLPEVVGDAAESVDPSEPEEIGRALVGILYDKTHANLLRALGKKNTLRFSWQTCADKTYQLYQSLS